MQYHISVNNVQQGPMEEEELKAKVANGEIPVHTALYWQPDMSNWEPLSKLFPNMPPPVSQTPPPPVSVPPPPPAPVDPRSAAEIDSSYNAANALSSGLQRYATFRGRASRAELFCFSAVFGLFMIIPYLDILFLLAGIVPMLAVGARRMHDIGKSGWFFIIPFYSTILACKPSDGPNRYGEKPLPPVD